jgi:glutathione S-transferase
VSVWRARAYRIQAFGPGEMREHKLHPFNRVPVIDHGDFRVYETQAILRSVDAVFPGPALQPAAPKSAARMNQIIGINDWYLFPQAARIIVVQRIVGPALMGVTPDEAAVSAALPEAERCFVELNRLLDDQPFLAGEQLAGAPACRFPRPWNHHHRERENARSERYGRIEQY